MARFTSPVITVFLELSLKFWSDAKQFIPRQVGGKNTAMRCLNQRLWDYVYAFQWRKNNKGCLWKAVGWLARQRQKKRPTAFHRWANCPGHYYGTALGEQLEALTSTIASSMKMDFEEEQSCHHRISWVCPRLSWYPKIRWFIMMINYFIYDTGSK